MKSSILSRSQSARGFAYSTWTIVFLAALAGGLGARVGRTAPFTWDQAIDGGNWSDLRWTGGVAGPTTAGNTATIENDIPGTWSAGNQTITVNVAVGSAGSPLDSLTIRDDVANSAVTLAINQDMYVATLNSLQDGAQRNVISIAGGRSLFVTDLNFTSNFHSSVSGAGAVRFVPNAGVSTFGYIGLDSDRYNVATWDFSDVGLSEMKYVNNGGGLSLEGRDLTWRVGNTAGNQIFTTTGGGGAPRLDQRAVGGAFNFVKIGVNDVDMGARGGGNPSFGFAISRALNGDHGGNQQRNLFTDAAGNATAGGTVRIADYDFLEQSTGAANFLLWDKIGSNLTITTGGQVTVRPRNTAALDEVSMVWVMSGKTLAIEGAGGDLEVDDLTAPLSSGRRGVYFAGATLDVSGDLRLLGPETFLNGAAAGGTVEVAGDATVQSQNPTGFGALNGLSGGHTAASDDFDLRTSTLEFDGGSTSLLDWDVNAPAVGFGNNPTLAAFSQANFALGTLSITNSTDVTLGAAQVLYLMEDIVIDSGSTLTLQGLLSEIHLLDPDLSELTRIQGYMGTEILAAGYSVVSTPGVGISIVVAPIPEPATWSLLGLGAVGLGWTVRRRNSRRTV